MSTKRGPGRPREFDGPPVRVRLPADLHDAICRDALRRERPVSVSQAIRERLERAFRSPNIVSTERPPLG